MLNTSSYHLAIGATEAYSALEIIVESSTDISSRSRCEYVEVVTFFDAVVEGRSTARGLRYGLVYS